MKMANLLQGPGSVDLIFESHNDVRMKMKEMMRKGHHF